MGFKNATTLIIERARTATTAMFFTNGLCIASLAPRYPEIKADLELSNTTYGLAIAAVPAGALLFGWLAGHVVRRYGDARTATFGTAFMAVAAWLSALSPHLILFVLPLIAMGAIDAIVDVAQNAHGLRVQRAAQRTLINSFHAFWSLGVVAGGLAASAMLYFSVAREIHLATIAIALTAVALMAYRARLPQDVGALERSTTTPANNTTDSSSLNSSPISNNSATSSPNGPSSLASTQSIPPRIWLILAGLSVLGIAACMIEDLGPAWSTQYMTSIGATAALAPFGYVSLMAAEFIGRITGDKLVDRYGQRTIAATGGALAVIGLSISIAFPSIPGTLIGFALAGFGVATIGPLAMEASDNLPYLKPGTGLTITSWLLRFGFLISPPLVGFLADHIELRFALIAYPAAGFIILALSGLLKPKTKQ